MSDLRPLTERERLFVDAYMGEAQGNGTEAARQTGYRGTAKVLAVQATRLLSKANVQAALAARRDVLSRQSIADATERREILTTIARSAQSDATARIRAIDVANKMDGAYIEKVEHSGHLDVPAAVTFVIQAQPGAVNRT